MISIYFVGYCHESTITFCEMDNMKMRLVETFTAHARKDIQFLRGLAVLAVILFHSFPKIFPYGYLGVDVFFVISGFLITPNLLRLNAHPFLKSRQGYLEYFNRRFLRLAPALGATIAVSLMLIFLFGNITDHQRLARQAILTIALLGNYGAIHYSGNYFAPNPNPLIHTWSLSVEEQIYLILPLSFIIIYFVFPKLKRSANNFLRLQVILFLLSFSLFLCFSFFATSTSYIFGISVEDFNFYSPFSRFWEFLAGGLLANVPQKSFLSQMSVIKLYRTCAFLLVIVLFGSLFSQIGLSIIFSVVLAGILIYIGSSSLISKYSSALVYLGDRSYSLYLVHMPLIYIFVFSPITNKFGSDFSRILIALILTFAVGELLFRHVEERFRTRRNIFKEGKKNFVKIIAICIVIPIFLASLMDIGFRNGYLGLEEKVPLYAGNLDSSCQRDSDQGPPCVYPVDNFQYSALLIGDSHAGHFSQAFIDAARDEGIQITIWVHQGCQVIFPELDIPTKSTEPKCQEVNEKILPWIQKNKPHLVIVSESFTNRKNVLKQISSLNMLKKVSPHLLVVGQNPTFTDIEFFGARSIVRSNRKFRHDVPANEIESQSVQAEKILRGWAGSNNISILNTWKTFCAENSCSRYRDGHWLYRDVEHLSVEGASIFIPQIRALYRVFLNIQS